MPRKRNATSINKTISTVNVSSIVYSTLNFDLRIIALTKQKSFIKMTATSTDKTIWNSINYAKQK